MTGEGVDKRTRHSGQEGRQRRPGGFLERRSMARMWLGADRDGKGVRPLGRDGQGSGLL